MYKPIPKYPAITKNLSLIVHRNILYSKVEGLIRLSGGSQLESITLVDLYVGSIVPESYKGFTFELIFRNQDRTLTYEEIQPNIANIVKTLQTIGIKLRS